MSNPPRIPPDPVPSDGGPLQPDPPGTPLRAVLTGVGIDFCGSQLVAELLRAFYVQSFVKPGMTDEQVVDALQSAQPSLALMLVDVALGSLMSVIAGYACARIVQRDERRVGALMAIASVLVGLLLGDAGAPDDLTLLYIACDVACVMLGVKFGIERNRRVEAMAREQIDARTP
ncbi:hypothetical protein [Scleromatobacter humisilvae]|uniref:Uncharacterized protein n=1 Tax=Scleromatobacter humisilvae TaxID=2897159 RepID=A0A9X1YQN6_9BURK|nr:hypothetical protein [Scleromatobacter humisilvae]MCK9689272.1 hypothetical protein [Scleromatobacter humisilvae]